MVRHKGPPGAPGLPGGYLMVYPGMLIMLLVMACNLFGDALRDALEQFKGFYEHQNSIKPNRPHTHRRRHC